MQCETSSVLTPTLIRERFKRIRDSLDESERKVNQIWHRCYTIPSSPEAPHPVAIAVSGLGALLLPQSIDRALVIHEEYLNLILLGWKTEEIRSRACCPGWIALCCGGRVRLPLLAFPPLRHRYHEGPVVFLRTGPSLYLCLFFTSPARAAFDERA